MSRERFESIVEEMVIGYEKVDAGKMMSAPGIRYKNKVFAFFYNDKMIFKLGKDYDIESHGVSEFTYLNPFKNKGPMTAWYEIDDKYEDKWLELAEVARLKMIDQLGE